MDSLKLATSPPPLPRPPKRLETRVAAGALVARGKKAEENFKKVADCSRDGNCIRIELSFILSTPKGDLYYTKPFFVRNVYFIHFFGFIGQLVLY